MKRKKEILIMELFGKKCRKGAFVEAKYKD
jgi:hypothetical protein